MRVAISPEELQILLKNDETSSLVSRLLSSSVLFLEGTEEQCDELRDACADLLLRIGFDEDYKPTETGITIESMIDKLAI